MNPNEMDSRWDTAVHMQILHLQIVNKRQEDRITELEQAIRNHKRMVAAGRRYNIFLNDEAHKDLWSLVNDDLSASDQCN